MMRSVLFAALACVAVPAWAAGAGAVGENLLWLAIILMAARLFAPLAQRLGFPAVLGELLLGVALGNLSLLGFHYFEPISSDPIVAFLAELGVVVLLLQIGLETKLHDLLRVGPRAFLVGGIGIAVPFALGAWLVGPLLLPGKDTNTYLFLGAALAATSVGITGRVFRDLGKLGLPEAQVVLGAAVIDDVLGLVILAVVSNLAQAGAVSFDEVIGIIAKAVFFLAGSILIGRAVAPYSARWLARLDRGPSMLFAQVLATGLFFAWLAYLIGLAPLVGAFAAGLLFEPLFLRDFETPEVVREIAPLLPEVSGGAHGIRQVLDKAVSRQHESLIEPIGYFFVPVFFVFTGMQVDLGTLADIQVVAVALGITLVAVVGKLVAGFAAGRGYNPWLIGWGMVPRGEVGLIFAMAGRQVDVVSESMFSAIVIMVILSTLLAPPILARLLR